jgi:hypothetical protein
VVREGRALDVARRLEEPYRRTSWPPSPAGTRWGACTLGFAVIRKSSRRTGDAQRGALR